MTATRPVPMPRAERRRLERNAPGTDGAGARDRTIAQILGETVALKLGPLLEEAFWRPACASCCRDAKVADLEHQVAVANAVAAAEPVPDAPPVRVSQAVTIDPQRGPVCWMHVEAGDG